MQQGKMRLTVFPARTAGAAGKKEDTKMEFEKLREIIADVLNMDPEEITQDSRFIEDLGADSLDVFQIIMGIETEFGIEIPSDAAEHIETVRDAADAIRNAAN